MSHLTKPPTSLSPIGLMDSDGTGEEGSTASFAKAKCYHPKAEGEAGGWSRTRGQLAPQLSSVREVVVH